MSSTGKLKSSSSELDLDRPNIEDYLPSGTTIQQEPHGKLRLRDLLDISPTLSEAAGAIVDDSFTRCFKSNPPEPWNWNVYLFPLWCFGVVVRYLILFPARVLVLTIGWIIFLSSFIPVHLLLKANDKLRRNIERCLVEMMCSFFVASWTGVVRYHGPRPSRRPKQVFVANHTSMIDFIILEQMTAFAVIMQKHPGWVGKNITISWVYGLLHLSSHVKHSLRRLFLAISSSESFRYFPLSLLAELDVAREFSPPFISRLRETVPEDCVLELLTFGFGALGTLGLVGDQGQEGFEVGHQFVGVVKQCLVFEGTRQFEPGAEMVTPVLSSTTDDNAMAGDGRKYVGEENRRLLQSTILESVGCIWFNRTEAKDREIVAKKLRDHVQGADNNPLLIFPEGTCVNNHYTVMFKKGAFELGCTVCPVAIKYNKIFVDAFWNSRKQSFTMHLLQLMTSWAVVCDVWYLEPQSLKPGETPIEFAERVRDIISHRAGLKMVPWDGYLKYSRPSPKHRERKQQNFAESVLRRLEEK
ncbi:glycerol-3-phosphate acyltransferase 9 [Senna tora]|uniref:Glycerol-3-phosphate acyltransferase 9 n=1 Tax=Senna tora TaxID=362788 RepID=A0A835CHH9_9FABA|nr:glycerol-3-phosphate acyltransferase 9 [Senna tora]